MKTNSLLTYLLYALLVALISIACYKACQMKKDKAEKTQEEAELQKTLRDMGYSSDSTASSSYTGGTSDSSAYYTSPAPDANGIVDAPTSSSTTTKTKPTTTTTTRSTPAQPAIAPPTTSTSTTTVKTTTGSTMTAKSGVSKVKGPGQGKYSVRAGTFNSREGARSRLEEVIKMGYQTAEVSPTKSGKWAVVILRSNDRTKASRMVDQLVSKGIDAALF